MNDVPAPPSALKRFNGKKILLTLVISAFPLTTLGVVFLCGFFLIKPGREILKPPSLKKSVYSFFSASPPVLGTVSERFVPREAKAEIIDQYFAIQQAPLSGYGQIFVAVAERYSLPWTLLPSIAMQESNGGKKIPDGTYNGWGWGITSQDTLGFDSWEHGIETVGRGLRRDYFDKGLDTPEAIMARYCPLSLDKGGTWAKGVEYFQRELLTF